LPKFVGNTSLLDFKDSSKPVISIEIESNNSSSITNKINVEFEFDQSETSNQISDIVIDGNKWANLNFVGDTTTIPVVSYNLPVGSLVAKLKPVVSPLANRSIHDFKFVAVDSNNGSEYLSLDSTGNIFLKKALSKDLLKYVFPFVKLNVEAFDPTDKIRKVQRLFHFLVNVTDRVEKASFEFPVVFQLDLNYKIYLRIGRFKLNKSAYPDDRFLVAIDENCTGFELDQAGNLYFAPTAFENGI
jgi:hypothetical protein